MIGFGPWLRKRTNRLMFWSTAARKNCSRTNFNLRKRTQSDLILEFRGQRFYVLSLPLCVCKLGGVDHLTRTLPSGFMHVDGKTAEVASASKVFLYLVSSIKGGTRAVPCLHVRRDPRREPDRASRAGGMHSLRLYAGLLRYLATVSQHRRGSI